MDIEKETREMFMSLPTWNARDALRMLLEVNPYSVIQEDDFAGTELEVEVRALIGWLYRYGILPRAIREPQDAAPELVADYLDAIGEVRRTPAEWIAAASANPGAPAEWLALLQPPSGALESVEPPVKAPANITRNRLRIDSLDAPIEKAIKQAGCLDTATVFTHLKELALNGEALPFTGVFEGAALCYTNDSDMPGTLTKNALDKRLAKRRKVTA